MEFFESALKLVKSDEAIFAIVVVVALIFMVAILKKRAKNSVTRSFDNNEKSEITVESKLESDATIQDSGNGNKDTTINIKI